MLAAGLALLILSTRGSVAQSGRSVERVEVDLILVDVEARDADGRPMRGLKAGDFDVFLDGVRRTLYSLDDHCGCADGGQAITAETGSRTADPGPGRSGLPPTSAAAGSPQSLPGAIAPADPGIWVLYFDFAFMDGGGRIRSIREAERWIRETMREGDQVMIVGSTFAGGAVVVKERGSVRAELLAALDAMREDRNLVDQHMSFLASRQLDCKNDHIQGIVSLPNCNANAHSEYFHGRATFKTLAQFTEALDSLTGKKHLVYFHEIAPFLPAGLYPGARHRMDQMPAVTEIAAAAVASRVAIHAVAPEGAGTVGQLLAEFTGGSYNRNRFDYSSALDVARNRCACSYRLGLEPVAGDLGRTHDVLVKVRGRSIANLRVRSYSRADRWMRKARGVLARPSVVRDLPLAASIEPVRAEKGRWDVRVQVALSGGALVRLPAGPSGTAEWECGALLVLEEGKQTWELLGVNSMSASSAAAAPGWFVHEQVIRGVPPGRYRLGAFVRDRAVDLFGGAAAALVLPDPSGRGLAGPIVQLSGRPALSSDLPLQPAARAAPTRGRVEPSRAVPAAERSREAAAEPPFEIHSWICGSAVADAVPAGLERFLSFDDAVVMSFDDADAALAPAGACVRLTDRVEAGLLDDAPYRYHLRWKPKGGEPIEVEAALP